MDYVCVLDCQIRIKGKIRMLEAGRVYDLAVDPKKPKCLVMVDSQDHILDFCTASEDELMAAKWKFSEADKVIQDKYGKKLKKEDQTTKRDVVEQILDIRYRAIDTSTVTPAN